MCDVWQLSDVVMCTSSIMHMCTISLDRYTAIRDPLRSRADRGRPTTFWLKIGAVWLASVVIGSPLIVLGVLSPSDLLSEDGQCAIVNQYYLVYGSLSAFFGPLTIMLVTFILTVRLLERESTQLAADGNEGMRRCTAERKAYPQLTNVTRTEGVASTGSGRRRRATRSSWMSRFSRSEAPTTTSMLPSPSKFPHETVVPTNTTFGPDVGDISHPIDREASRDTSRDADAAMRTETEASGQRVTSSTTACCDKLSSAETGSCVVDVSTSTHAPHTALGVNSDDVTNLDSSSVSDRRIAVVSGNGLRSVKATSARNSTDVTSSSGEAVMGEIRASDRCKDEQQNSTRLIKSTSEFSTLRLPEVVAQRRYVAVTSLDPSGKVAERLRRVMVSLHPGYVDGERCCLLKHADEGRRYIADDDVIKQLPVPVQLADETQYRDAPRVSGTATETIAMRRSRSDSAVGIQPPTCCHSNVNQSRDPAPPTSNVDNGDTVNDSAADVQRPLAANTAIATTNMAATSDVIVADVGEENNGTGNQMIRSTSGADRFKGLVRKHGAAFQVAGMLRATREDRQQKAFNSVKTESKAVKVLGTMFAIFVTCWAPFFTANLMMGVCSTCYVDPLLFKVFNVLFIKDLLV